MPDNVGVDWLAEIERLYELEAEATRLLTLAVSGGRKAGRSWKEIATSMGITQQGARQRFVKKVAS